MLGKSGSGKSYLAIFQTRAFPRVLIHDPNGTPAFARGASVAYTPRQLIHLIRTPGRVRICWRGYLDPAMQDDAFEVANEIAFAAGRCAILWDEVARFTPKVRLPDHAFRIATQGRHRDIHIIATSQRPTTIRPALRSLATRMCVFQMDDPGDIAYVAGWVGRVAAESLRGLARYSCLDWQEGKTAQIRRSPFA